MKFNLPLSIASSQDIAGLITEIHEYGAWLNHQAVKRRISKKVTGQAPELSPATEEIISQWIGRRDPDRQSMDALAASLEHHRRTAPSATITLAAPPSANVKAELTTKLRKYLSPDLLVNYQFNSTILGGMVVRYGSHVYDWSFRRKILAERQRFAEVLRHV